MIQIFLSILYLHLLKNALKIELTEEGKVYLSELDIDKYKTGDGSYAPFENDFYDMLDDVQGNSEYIYHSNIGDSGFGLTSAPGITDGYYLNDDGEYEASDETSSVYWYSGYETNSFIDDLIEDGETYFQKV